MPEELKNNKEYSWEQFDEFKGRFSSKISINKGGGISFSSGFLNKHDLKKNRFVQMFFDKDKMAIAFRFFENKEENTKGIADITIRKSTQSQYGYLSALSFVNKYGIDTNIFAGRYEPVEIIDESLGKIVIINLKEQKK